MSSIHKLKDQSLSEDINLDDQNKGSVKLTDLLSRLKEEKKKERNSNIALSVAAKSAITVLIQSLLLDIFRSIRYFN